MSVTDSSRSSLQALYSEKLSERRWLRRGRRIKHIIFRVVGYNPFGGVALARKSLLFLVALWVLFISCGDGPSQPASLKTIIFDSAKESAEGEILLDEISKDFPRSWAGHEALVLEFKASSSQRMNLKIMTEKGDFSRVRLHPYPNVWVRAAIPMQFLAEPPKTGHDMAAVGNRSRPGYYIGLIGPFVELSEVKSIAFEMIRPVGSPSLEVRAVSLAIESPGDAILEGTPVVDAFGQFVHDSWPGKAESLEQLRKAWDEEEAGLTPGDYGYCQYGGFINTKARATGFFRVEKTDGVWWFVDPDGHLFLSAGSDVMQPNQVTRLEGREDFFSELPPSDLLPQPRFRREGDPGVSFFTWNLSRRFGDDWLNKWVDFTLRRMDAWGLNTIANWSSPRLAEVQKKPYVIPLRGWSTEIHYLGLPDVYSPEFERLADERAQAQCEARKDDPWLLGYFLANEPPFPQKALQTVQLILEGPETDTKKELQKWLTSEDTPERREQFIAEAFHKYIQVASAAVKRHDPNHLNLGMRSGGRPTEAEIQAAGAFDVYSVNIYRPQVPVERVRQISELTGKPILIGEFHFGTPARGLAASLVQVRDHRERGTAYRYYVEQAFAMPELIGTHWFQWMDQMCTGRFDGENYNLGIVDVTDRPYPDMVEALKETHRRLFQVHSGELEPFSTQAVVN